MTPESQIKRYTVPEFASRIRSKYPDQYKDLSDDDLTMRVLAKHPEYKSHVNLGTAEQAQADVARTKTQFDKASSAYMSAAGKTFNPVVTLGTDYFRPLTTAEQAAQKRGEPVVISEASQQAPVAPEQTSRPRTVTPAPVSLDSVIQGHLEQVKREKRQRDTQQKVAQARQAMQRGRPLYSGSGRAFGDPASPERQQAIRSVLEPEQGRGAGELRRLESKEPKGSMVMGDFRRREERDARVAREIRPQVVKDYFGMGAGGVRQDIPTELAEQQIAADPRLQEYIAQETERRAKVLEEREGAVSRVERGIADRKGLADKVREIGNNPAQLIPFLSSLPEIDNVLKAGEAAEKLERGELLTTEESVRLRGFLASGKQGKTIPYQVADVVSGLPAFIGELALTSGAFSAGRAAAVKGLERLATKQGLAAIEKKLVGRLAVKSVENLAGAAAQFVPAGATRIPAGVLYREQEGAEFSKALRDTLTDQFIEIASERTGGLLTHIPLPKRIPAIRDAVTARWIARVPGRTAGQLQKLVDKAGWHGPLGEIFEERVADVAKYGTGLQASPIPSLEQLAVEGLAFSVPGAVEAVANKTLQTKTPAPQTLIDYALNSPLTSAADKAKIEKLVESGGSAEEVQAVLSGESSSVHGTEAKEVKPDYRPKETASSTPQALRLRELPENLQESLQNITETITKPDPLSEPANKISPIPTTQSQGQPAIEPAEAPPAEIKTQPTATESQLTTVKEVTDEVDAEAPNLLAQPITQAPGQGTVPDKSQKSEIISEKIATPVKAAVSPKEITKEPLRLNEEVGEDGENRSFQAPGKPTPAGRLTDWSTRLKTIAQAKDLDQLQALSDEMAAHKDDPRVARLRTSIQEQIARARQRSVYTEKAALTEAEKPSKTEGSASGLYTNKPSKAAAKTLKQAETPEGKDLERKQPLPESGQSSMFARDGEGEAPAFSVEANRIALDRHGIQLLSDAYRQNGTFDPKDRNAVGAFDRNPETTARTLEQMATEGRTGARELADVIRRAAGYGQGKVVLFGSESARKHELFHEASDKADRRLRDRHGASGFETLTDTDAFSKMYRHLTAVGYPQYNMPTLVEEAAAYIAEGRYESLGITRDEAVEWMFKWFKSFEAKNPHVNPRQFQEMSDEATKARDEVYAQSTASQPLNDEALPSVQAGREGGDRESIAAARSPDITQTEAFKRWFGDSKVVDEDGNPLLVYHGTTADFDTFTQDKIGLGYFFIEDVETANTFATEMHEAAASSRQGDAVMPVYLSLQNPKRETLATLEALEDDYARSSDYRATAEKQGHDGLIFSGEFEGFKRVEFVAFRPEQIKSAIGNRGTFDPHDPNILMARSEKPSDETIIGENAGEGIEIHGPTQGGGFYIGDKAGNVWGGEAWRPFGAPDYYGTFQEAFRKTREIKEKAGPPKDPDQATLFARSDDPWADLMELSEEFGRLANEPELAEGEKETKQSRLAAGVEAKAIEAKLTAGFQGLPEYGTVKVADQARMASELLRNDPQEARRVAMGQSIPPDNLLPESVFVAVENDALQRGDVALLRELATTSSLSLEATGMGQRIRMLAERNPYSPVTAIKEVAKARETRAKKKMGPKFRERVVTEIKTEVRKKAPKAKDWRGFLEEIKCR